MRTYLLGLKNYSYWKDDDGLVLEMWERHLAPYEIGEIREAVKFLINHRHGFITLAGIKEYLKKKRLKKTKGER